MEKQMDKEGVIVIGLSMLALVLWMLFFQNQASYTPENNNNKQKQIEKTLKHEKKLEGKKKSSSDTTYDITKNNKKESGRTAITQLSATKSSIKTDKHFKPISDVRIENEYEEVIVDPNEGKIKSVILKKYLMTDKLCPVVMCKNDIPPGTLSITADVPWKTIYVKSFTPSKTKCIVIRKVLINSAAAEPAILQIKQTWELDSLYSIKYKVSITNLSAEISFKHLYFNAGSISPVKILSGDNVRRELHYIDYCLQGTSVESIHADAKNIPNTIDSPVLWTSVSNKYFCVILKASSPITDGIVNFRDKKEALYKGKNENYYVISSALRTKPLVLAKNERKSFDFSLYAGPKILKNLENFVPSGTHIMRLSFISWFEWISQMLLRGLNYLKIICGSYGLSIILLTLIVRALFWPITQKANTSMRKMQQIQPQLQELRKRFADNPQELNKRMMQLYRENKVNPLGGCLPILLQIPVFLALYSTLDGSIQLRHAAFLWAHDLSRPDTVAVIFGLPIHPLILIMTVTMVIQQMLTPTAADPVQQKMMYLLPLFMLIFLYSLPSGLTLYWSVSQIISIIQLLINKRIMQKEEAASPS